MTPEELAQMIRDLKAAIATGALEIETYTGGVRKRVKYRDLAEMRSILSALQGEATATPSVRRTFAAFDNGAG